jgi:hypothetical protein
MLEDPEVKEEAIAYQVTVIVFDSFLFSSNVPVTT